MSAFTPQAEVTPTTVTLTLSEDQAIGLLALIGSIGGTPGWYRNEIIDPLYAVLSDTLAPEHFVYRWAEKEILRRHGGAVEIAGALQFGYGEGFPYRLSELT